MRELMKLNYYPGEPNHARNTLCIPDDSMRELLRRGICPECGFDKWMQNDSTVTMQCATCYQMYSKETPPNAE